MTIRLPKFVVTSVVRGSTIGNSDGGVYIVDFEKQLAEQHIDWSTSEVQIQGHGGERGLRGIAFDGDDIYIASGDSLFRYDRSFKIKTSNKNHYLGDCHEICRFERMIFLTSAEFDSLLAFDLEKKKYVWGFHLIRQHDQWAGHRFDPCSDMGPIRVDEYHINMVHVDSTGIYFSGLRTNALLHIDGEMQVSEVCSLPAGAHNARPYRDGVLFNDTESNCVRFAGRDGHDLAFKTVTYDEGDIDFAGVDAPEIVRQGFGRGLCTVGDRFVAGGSSPSTITLYDFEAHQTVGSVNLSKDIRNAIHGLEPWPFDD